MPRKRHTATHEEELLNYVIGAIETDDDARYTEALNRLLRHGPVVCHPDDADLAALLRLELLAFLRSIVRDSAVGRDSYSGLDFSRVRVTAYVNHKGPGSVQISASGSARDLVKFQLVTLVQTVGLRNVRQCAAPDCQRIFVKQWRREFCTKTCQNRTFMRAKRLAEIHQREQRAAIRRRRAH